MPKETTKETKEEKPKSDLEKVREEISNQIAQIRALITNQSADYVLWIERRDEAKKQLDGCQNNLTAHKTNLDKLKSQEESLSFAVNTIDGIVNAKK